MLPTKQRREDGLRGQAMHDSTMHNGLFHPKKGEQVGQLTSLSILNALGPPL